MSAFQQVEQLFHEVLAVAPEKRRAFLDTRCGGDATLRDAVEELLRHDHARHQTDTFLAGPLAQAAGQLRDQRPTLANEPPPIPPEPPPAVPGYEILEELGRGGMGVVYKARQTSLNRPVALKMLLPGRASAADTLARFRIETEALARLHHPNIVTIYDIGSADGRPYFSMEFISGGSLAQLLDERPQDITGSARLLETLARTMDAVHREGIVHRDLKPANILIGTESKSSLSTQQSVLSMVFPKISDFGVARLHGAGVRLTQTGMVMGTLAYMAPEQARSGGHDVGPAADQYALGSILYEMLTGRPPFQADTPAETIDQLLNVEPVSPVYLRPRVPRDLTTICLKCLEKSPRQRYVSSLELAEDLRRFQAGKPIHARPVSLLGRATRWCRRKPLAAGLLFLSLALALALVIMAFVYNSRLEDALAQSEKTAERERRQLVTANFLIGQAELDRGDAFLALLRFASALELEEGHGEREADLRREIAGTLRQCPLPVDFRVRKQRLLCLQVDASGGWLVLSTEHQQLEVCEAFTGQAAGPPLSLPEPVQAGAVSRDGRWLVTLGKTARLWDVSRGQSQELPCRPAQAITRAFFHADGRILLTEHADATLRRWDLTKPPLTMPEPFTSDRLLSVSDDNRWFFTVAQDQKGQLWDLGKGHAVGKPVALREKISRCAIGPGGRLLALMGASNVLHFWDVSADGWTPTASRLGQPIEQVALGAAGERVLIVAGNQGARLWRFPSSELVAVLSPTPARGSDVHFSPDGSLVIAHDRAGAGRLWEAASGRPTTPPLRHGGPLVTALRRPDGHLVTISRSGTVATWSLPLHRSAKNPELPESKPVDQLIALAELLASSQLDEQQIRRDLTADELQARWEAVQQQEKRAP